MSVVYNLEKTLFALACETVALHLKDARDVEQLPLPQLIKREVREVIKDVWICQGPLQDPYEYNYSEIELWNMSRTDLNMIMNYPRELGVPGFLPDNVCHVVWHYYLWECVDRRFTVCKYCYRYVCLLLLDRERREAKWGLDGLCGWRFFEATNHDRLHPEVVFEDIIQRETNYCDICVTTPLYDVMERHECIYRHNYHSKIARAEETDSETDNDNDSSHLQYQMVHPEVL